MGMRTPGPVGSTMSAECTCHLDSDIMGLAVPRRTISMGEQRAILRKCFVRSNLRSTIALIKATAC